MTSIQDYRPEWKSYPKECSMFTISPAVVDKNRPICLLSTVSLTVVLHGEIKLIGYM